MDRVCLDTCCLNRPFDDRSQRRIHREAEAVERIIDEANNGLIHIMCSDALIAEANQAKSVQRRDELLAILNSATINVSLGARERARADELEMLGFRGMVALHVACAESGQASAFLTTDDRLLRTARRNKDLISVDVVNPLHWTAEESG